MNSDYQMKKKIICKYSLFKECFKTIIISCDCFCIMKIETNWHAYMCMSIKGFPANETFREKMQKKLVTFSHSRNVWCLLVVLESSFIFCVIQQLGSRINSLFENETCILKKSFLMNFRNFFDKILHLFKNFGIVRGLFVFFVWIISIFSKFSRFFAKYLHFFTKF